MTWKPYEPKPREPYAEAPAIGSAASADFPRDKVVQIPRSDLKALLTVDDCLKTTEAQAACIRSQQAEIARLNDLVAREVENANRYAAIGEEQRRQIDELRHKVAEQQDEIKALKMSAAYAEGHETRRGEIIGQWVPCSPELLRGGTDCGSTPRRPGCSDHSHDHFIVPGFKVAAVSEADLTDDAPKEPESILLEAHRLVHGDRGADYGHPLDNHGCTAALWAAYLERRFRLAPGTLPLTARDVCWLNIFQKGSRDANAPKRDNLTDTAGYAENAHMAADEQARRAKS